VTIQSDLLREIPIEFLQPGRYQPRKDMKTEALEELAQSIKTQGIMQPIVVRRIHHTGEKERFEIIAGERRWRAAQLAQLDVIPALIKDVPDEAAIAMALIENIQREDLSAIEEAEALYRLQQEFELSHQEVADAVGKSRTTVTNLLRLINLGPDAKNLLEHGDIEMGHARAILNLPADLQAQVARQIANKGLSVRQTEALVKKLANGEKLSDKARPAEKHTDIKHLENQLSEKLGASVQIQHTEKGKGKLVIQYNSLDELDGILDHIK
jgi:ParB family chromosome partitioning protein